jgi:DNA mismatch endonuclease, patch repair protein
LDTFSPEKRSEIMRRVHSTDTTPEKKVRSLLHGLGFRFRLHRSDLPGKPDIVLPKYRAAIFIHGCFWHRHPGCPRASTPATRREYWLPKFERTEQRDRINQAKLIELGWRVVVIWECEIRDLEHLGEILTHAITAPMMEYSHNEPIVLLAAETQANYAK